MTVARQALGREGVPLVIVDGAHPAPDALRAIAAERHFGRTDADFYPGVRAEAPADYAAWLAPLASALWRRDEMSVLRSSFAVASDSVADLAPIQRIPHFDTDDALVVAAIHYLCGPPLGGTSFYRHRRTGYERIDRMRLLSWRQALNRDLREQGMPGPDDCASDAAAFERIGTAALRFNRLILYPANCLHAGDLMESDPGSSSGSGRLTLTSLLR